MTRRYRPVVAVLLALLLVLFQQGAKLHALEHDRLQRPHDTGLQLPVGESPCAMCALFAGGNDAATAITNAHAEPPVDFVTTPRAIAVVALGSPSPYQSRAPPPTL